MAVYVYGITAPYKPSLVGCTVDDTVTTIDDVTYVLVGNDDNAPWVYNALLYEQTGLEDGPHQIRCQLGNGSTPETWLFDYMTYTNEEGALVEPATPVSATLSSLVSSLPSTASGTESATSATSIAIVTSTVLYTAAAGLATSGASASRVPLQRVQTPIIIGAVLGTAALFIAIGVGIYIYYRSSRRGKGDIIRFGAQTSHPFWGTR